MHRKAPYKNDLVPDFNSADVEKPCPKIIIYSKGLSYLYFRPYLDKRLQFYGGLKLIGNMGLDEIVEGTAFWPIREWTTARKEARRVH